MVCLSKNPTHKMIIFQLPPCRLYPRICEAINNQFSNSLYIHEVFELSEDEYYKSVNNDLKITPKNFKFGRYDIIFGIFNINKINKQPGDLHLTIKFKKEDLIKEYFAGLRYYGSLGFSKDAKTKSDYCLSNLLSRFNRLSDEDLFSILKRKKYEQFPLKYKEISYKLKEDLLTQDGDFDYVGKFDNWEETILDIKKLTGVDLTHLKNEKTKSYKNKI